jgi:hypothetical protein
MPTSGEALGAIKTALSSPPLPWSNGTSLRCPRLLSLKVSISHLAESVKTQFWMNTIIKNTLD